ncbi:hypothetical protein QMK38_01165 [Lysinibacillus fusiformis]|nr:hypothetical protein [Lysinibacillus fusiformis]
MEKKKLLKRAIIREELIAITGNLFEAVLLNQLIYWTQRVKDYEQFQHEETKRIQSQNENNETPLFGWIYKKADELREETMLCCNENTIRKHLKELINKGYLNQRNNSKFKWDRTYQYRLNAKKLIEDLNTLQYHLEEFEILSPNSKIEIRNDENNGTIPKNTSESTTISTSITKLEKKKSDEYERVEGLFLKLSKRNQLTKNDQKAIKRILKKGYELEQILTWIRECFEKYQPINGNEGIWAFNYIAKFIEQKGENYNENNEPIINRGRSHGNFKHLQHGRSEKDNGRWLGDTECDF